jgi:hypothetical protein
MNVLNAIKEGAVAAVREGEEAASKNAERLERLLLDYL